MVKNKDMEAQQILAELDPIPVQPSEAPPEANPSGKLIFGSKLRKCKPLSHDSDGGNPKLNPIDRGQLMLRTIDLERLLEPAHPARAMGD